MKPLVQLLVIAFVLLLGTGAVLWFTMRGNDGGAMADGRGASAQGQGPPAQAVEVTKVQRGDMRRTLRLVGSLTAEEEAEIKAEEEGIVRRVLFREGAEVKAGDVLVEIDDRELTALLAEADARLALAGSTLERGRQAAVGGGISRQELDQMQAELARVSAERDGIKVRLDRTRVRAPFDGVAGARHVSPGEYVSNSRLITTVVDKSRLKVDVQVPERFLRNVAAGSRFIVLQRDQALDAGESTVPGIEGEVYFVAPSIDRETRSALVRGYVEAPGDEFKPGMFATVDMVLETREGVLRVPEGAILHGPQGTALVRLQTEEGSAQGGKAKAEFVPVRTGLRERGWVEVEAVAMPVSEGDRIVASGVGGLILFPGLELEPRPWREEFRVGSR